MRQLQPSFRPFSKKSINRIQRLTLLFFLLASTHVVFAQQNITGTVSNGINPLVGVTVTVKSTNSAVLLNNVSEAIIRNCNALSGTETFIYVEGDDSHDIIIRDNNFLKGKKGAIFEKDSIKNQVKMNFNL